MRVLRLDLGRNRIELHPYVTVIRGLDPEVRARLLAVLAEIPGGQSSVGGLIEAHGILLDLAPATLGLLDLQTDLDVVVRPGDLPGAPAAASTNGSTPIAETVAAPVDDLVGPAEAAVAAARADVDEATRHRDLAAAALEADGDDDPLAGIGGDRGEHGAVDGGAGAEARTAAARAVDAAEDRLHRALAVLQEAESAAAAAREERRDAAKAVSAAVGALEGAGERRDPTAGAVVEAAKARLADAEAVLDEVRRGGEAAAEPGADEVDGEALQAQRHVAQAALLALDTSDPLPVRMALDHLRDGGSVELLPSPEAVALADEVAELEGHLARFPAASSDSAVQAEEREVARRRFDLATQSLAELEASSRAPGFDPTDVKELEAAHLEVLEARDAVGKRFGGARAKGRLEEVEAAEQAVLDRMGLVTYTEYLMGAGGAASSGAPTDETLPERIEQARLDLAKAEAQLQNREADVVDELARAELLDRRRILRGRAVELLGTDPGDDVEGALRRHRVSAADTGEHLHRLRQALEGAGLALADEDVEERLLTDLAKVWLREQGDTEGKRRELEQEIATIDVQLSSAEAREAAPDLDEPLAVAAGAVEDAKRALAAAEIRLERDRVAAEEVEALRTAFAEASSGDAAAAAAVLAAEEQVRAAAAAAKAEADAVREAEHALAAATAAATAEAEAEAALAARLAEARAGGRAALAGELDEAERALVAAAAALAAAEDELAAARRAAAEAPAPTPAVEVPVAATPSVVDGERSIDDIEWYLLARLAAQRSVSYAGSVPLVLDDALVGLEPSASRSILDRLERMAATVQLVVVTEDLATAAWAEGLGDDRAVVSEGRPGSS